jgi:hypothetical protein
MKERILSSNEKQISLVYFWWISARIFIRKNIVIRFRNFKSRRPHRSFKLSKKRDYTRPLEIGGYWNLLGSVFGLIRENKSIFRNLVLVSSLASILLVGLMDQNFVSSLQAVVDTTNGGNFEGFFGEIGKAGLVMAATFNSGGLVQYPTEIQQIMFAIIILFIWLATVQICRNILSGKKNLNLRDALYSCGAPIIPMTVIAIVILMQLVPVFIATIVGAAAKTTSFLSSGIEQAVFFSAILLLFSLSAFWVMGSIFAMIIVTIPGTYPLQALKIAGDMVSQRRLAILKRILFLIFILALIWSIIIIPIIMLMNWLISINGFFVNIPIVPISMLLMSCFSCVLSSVYIYVLYRRIVDGDR